MTPVARVALFLLLAGCAGAAADDGLRFPDASTTGVPQGWVPKRVEHSEVRIEQPGAVVADLRIVDADLVIDAENVTVRRVELLGGHIRNDPRDVCRNGLALEDVSILPGQRTTSDADPPAVGPGGYVARRVKIEGVPEGFRVGGRSIGCRDVVIEDSFARIVAPSACKDWHGDGIQGYDGAKLILRNVSLELVETQDCSGTAAFFYPAGQGNAAVDIDGLLVKGGGFPFRLGAPGTVRGLRVIDGSWSYQPVTADCKLVASWDAAVSSGAAAEPAIRSRQLPCSE